MITLNSVKLPTPLGSVMALMNDQALYFLEFTESRGFHRRLGHFIKKIKAHIDEKESSLTQLLQQELNQYFKGNLHTFQTPLMLFGTDFQKQVWDTLRKIPWGETLSYSGLAQAIGHPLACRAVANANASNHMAIIIPCHRVIQANGYLGGYGGGSDRKRKLLDLEGAHYWV